MRSGLARGDQHPCILVAASLEAKQRKMTANRQRKILVRQCTLTRMEENAQMLIVKDEQCRLAGELSLKERCHSCSTATFGIHPHEDAIMMLRPSPMPRAPYASKPPSWAISSLFSVRLLQMSECLCFSHQTQLVAGRPFWRRGDEVCAPSSSVSRKE